MGENIPGHKKLCQGMEAEEQITSLLGSLEWCKDDSKAGKIGKGQNIGILGDHYENWMSY